MQAVHLRLLEEAHAAVWREHEDVDALFAAHGVFGGGAGVAGGGAEDVEARVAGFEDVGHGVAEELHGDVFEGERGAIREFEQVGVAVAEAGQRGDVCAAEGVSGVGTAQDGAQVVFRDVADEGVHDGVGEIGVVEFAPAFEGFAADVRNFARHGQTAIGRKALQEDVAEAAEFGATGGLVLHGVLLVCCLGPTRYAGFLATLSSAPVCPARQQTQSCSCFFQR